MPTPAAIQYATFTGIGRVLSASFTLSHGITPSCCVLEIVPQADIPSATGDLVFIYDAITLTFSGCRVDYTSIQRNSSGMVMALAVQDRRWKWQFGDISGDYNTRFQDPGSVAPDSGKSVGNSLDPDFLRTPQQLAALCLQALGEVNYDVSLMPNDTYPEVHWTAQNPAQALAALCDTLNCRISLDANQAVVIWPVGVGHALPDGPVMSGGNKLPVKPHPDTVKVVCGPSLFQVDFILYPVGLDTDGGIWPLYQLSYRPNKQNPNGPAESVWDYEVPGQFVGISDQLLTTGQTKRQLALESVWRWYKIGGTITPALVGEQAQVNGSYLTNDLQIYNIPGYGQIPTFKVPKWLAAAEVGKPGKPYVAASYTLLPLEEEQVQTYVSADATLRRLPAICYGVYNDRRGAQTNTPPGTPYEGGFQVDGRHGLVKFDQPVWQYLPDPLNNGKFVYRPAWLALRTAFQIRDLTTGAYVRYERTFFFADQSGTGAKPLHHPEIQSEYYPTYDAKGNVQKVNNNESLVGAECDYYIGAEAAQYLSQAVPQEITYAGLIPISTDGAIQQVTWSVSNTSGATTHVCRNDEFHPYVPPFRERRVYEQVRNDTIEALRGIASKQGKEFLDL